ncbi:DEAD/DEAH box helicase family protein [Mycobacterium sp. 663a-19]|uniref:DEAD/DEAH box helicase family protein n=1 Tax=Mycobacterium sp. 663a-19 TaxID=2986148 RepID=UPI002D1E5BD8|nr:DEAD/DEAH box helicase family protein [Mycobacterium sp. 663a-19]MEB3980215.1 DEAD/DEAH box helicase family protein [Mycobacterium sp. 663a-19]
MDFEKFLADSAQAAPIEPRELFASLPNKAEGYGYLRDVQGQVLTAWHERRGTRDLVIKVNTGAGKTIDGLIILQSYLNEGLGPALYVAPNKYLVAQVIEEAERIGLATVEDPDSTKYRLGQAICVVNAWKLFNGRSVFRQRPTKAPAPIGVVVIDDAHAALSTARGCLSIDIPYEDPAFKALLDEFRDDLEAYSPNELLDVTDQSAGALLRVPFWAWRSHLEGARKILHQAEGTASESDQIYWSWPAVKDVLEYCRTVFTGRQVTITPLCSPVGHITNFKSASRRIYLTATLADDSVLVTDFGADPTSVATPITPQTAGDIGERMILAPMELSPQLAIEGVRAGIAALAEKHNVVVIAPSRRIADLWLPYTPESNIVYADAVADAVERLRNGHVGLVVLVNKYDGIDLPGNACRVLILDGLPEAFSGEERLETHLTSYTSGTDDRQVQRIEQGMGRGVRSNEDHCVVFLLGARLTQLVYDPDTLARFSPASQVQLEQSRQMAGGLENEPLTAIIDVARQALDRHPAWIKYARQGLAHVAPSPGHVGAAAIGRRTAFDRAVDGDLAGAAAALTEAIADTADPHQQGWLLEQQATYVDRTNPAHAQKVLTSARAKNGAVLRPLVGTTYQKLSGSDHQAVAASDFLMQRYKDKVEIRMGIEALLEDLRFDPARTDEFEDALVELARHIGLAAQRPEHDIGQGPDGLWALGQLKYWVIEAKSGATTTFIKKSYINQLAGSMNWFEGQYDSTVTALPILIHPSDTLAKDASAPSGARVITEPKMEALRSAVRDYADALVTAGRWDQPDDLQTLLAGHKLRAGDLFGYTRAIKPG